ncbi:cytochrome c biogenesis protein ResB [bacterium]|nr:cytochrome c biogenesis protein ResB [bacterium]
MTPTTDDPLPDGTPRPLPPRRAPGPLDYAYKGLKALSSLQLTVWLFAFSIALVFFGTVAQMEAGIWAVVDQYFWSWVVWVPTDLIRQFGSVFLSEWFPKDAVRWKATFPLPGGKLLGGLMLANLLAAHMVRFRLTWKRSGVILIHSGIILLFVGEFVTREYAVEQRMSIRQGATVNYTEDSRHMELAFVDSSDPKEDKVVAIPESLLRSGGRRISDPQLPVDVEVVEYFTNSALEKVQTAAKSNPATAGTGKGIVAVKRSDVSGVDPNQKIDLPAAYVRLFDKNGGGELGTYLVALQITSMGGHEDVTAGGKTYQMNLRNIRYYKPYSLHLVEFRFDRYPGTQKAKNFSSEVILKDGDYERQQVIKMNDPLRYAGETFYQSSFDPDEGGTVLQVVKNPGWLIPYVSCAVVSFGMLLHFGIYLTQFLLRRAAA